MLSTKQKKERQRRAGVSSAAVGTSSREQQLQLQDAAKPAKAATAATTFDPNGTLAVARGVWKTSSNKHKLTAAAAATDHNNNNSSANQQQQHNKQKRRQQYQGGDKKTRAVLERLEGRRHAAVAAAAQAVQILQDGAGSGSGFGQLEAEHEWERTTAVTQVQLKRHHLDATTAANSIYDLHLNKSAAPYLFKYDRTGRYSCLAGQGGHVAVLDCQQQSLVTEFHLPNEHIRDVTFLHNFTLAAVAQRNHVYIYDSTSGAEVHCLQQHTDPAKLVYLPYHWLLASAGRSGHVKYHDVSTGNLVATHRTRLGPAAALRVNPASAVLHVGHTNGTVTLWSPAQQNSYLAKVLCHRGAAVTDLVVAENGRTMVTAGQNRQICVWDLRKLSSSSSSASASASELSPFLHAYYCAAGVPASLDVSQRGLLAVGHAGHVTVWGAEALHCKVRSPYLHHALGPGQGPVATVRFRPFEDACGIGRASGVSSIAVPGSGEPALDTAELNPAADARQRREAEVRSLLDKLPPDTIALDPSAVGGMEQQQQQQPAPGERSAVRDDDAADDDNGEAGGGGDGGSATVTTNKTGGKKRGRSKIQTKLRRKRKNIIDQNLLLLRDAREKETLAKQQQHQQTKGRHSAGGETANTTEAAKDSAPAALKRFF